MEENVDATCTFLFKKRTIRKQGSRKRPEKSNTSESDTSSSDAETAVVRPKKKGKINPNIQSSKKLKGNKSDANDDKSSDSDSVIVNYKSKRLAVAIGPSDQGATATLETETEKDRDAQALFEKRLATNKELDGEDDKIYRGLNNYAQYSKQTSANSSNSDLVRRRPIRAPDNLRATVRWDYQPDVCKDYKETGFCGFGDSCKFLHDRSDYKHGWQLENEFIADKGNDSDDEDSKKYEIDFDKEDLPFKCFICRNSFVNPVVTKCKHYFCEACALKRFKKTTRCAACNKQTNGTFNPAKDLIAKLENLRSAQQSDENDSCSD